MIIDALPHQQTTLVHSYYLRLNFTSLNRAASLAKEEDENIHAGRAQIEACEDRANRSVHIRVPSSAEVGGMTVGPNCKATVVSQ